MLEYNFIVSVIFTASLSFYPAPCGSVEYYVTPTIPPNTDCPQPCYTLDYYALNTSLLSNRENVSLLFLEGSHTLQYTFRISNIEVLVVAESQKYRSTINSPGNVTINGEGYRGPGIEFKNISFLIMENLKLKANWRYESVLLLVSKTILLNWLVVDGLTIKHAGEKIDVNSSFFTGCWFDQICLPAYHTHSDISITKQILSFSRSKLLNSYVHQLIPSSEQYCRDSKNHIQLSFSKCTITIRSARFARKQLAVPIIELWIRTDTIIVHLEINDSYLDGGITVEPRANNISIILLVHACRITGSMFSTIIDIQPYATSRHHQYCSLHYG